jgi:membrane protease YdiL (CAAX protease family)
MMIFIFVIESIMGWLRIDSFAWDGDSTGTIIFQTVLYFLSFILVGWNEELLSRGYHLQNIAMGLNLFWAVIISSLFFGLLHIGNPHVSWNGVIGIVFAGLFLAYGYVRTRRLWFPIGFHIGWNFFEGVVFGFPVSGTETFRIIITTVTGPEIWTGGLFGPEGGLVVIPVLILGAILTRFYTRNRGALQKSCV